MSERPRSALFLVPTLRGGGAERVTVTLLRHLDRARFRPAVGVVDSSGAAFRDDIPPDVEFIDLHSTRVRYAAPKIGQLIWEKKPDLVFSTLGHLNLTLAAMRPLLPSKTRFVAREANTVTEVNRERARAPFWTWAYRRFYARFDAVVCQSRYMRDDLVQNFGLPPELAVVIHNPVEIDRIRQLAFEPVATGFEPRHVKGKGTPIRLVACGRLSRQKGFDLLIEAVALCKDSHLRLTILGTGSLRLELDHLARDRGVAKQVEFVGFQKNPYPFFAQADLFVLSSRYEGFPNVALEAMACGTPVVSTPARGGVLELLDGVPGCVLADSVTPAALAEAIQGMRGAGRLSSTVVDEYAVDKIAEDYSHALLRVLDA